jgi:hypothetical protein
MEQNLTMTHVATKLLSANGTISLITVFTDSAIGLSLTSDKSTLRPLFLNYIF